MSRAVRPDAIPNATQNPTPDMSSNVRRSMGTVVEAVGDLAAEGIVVRRGGRDIVDHVDVTATPGRILAVTGTSGSGKTTLLSVLGGLIDPDAGFLSYGKNKLRAGDRAFRRQTGFVLQLYGLVPLLTAAENLEVALRARDVGPLDARRRTEEELERLGLAAVANRSVDELSGGQQQRVAVARALVTEPVILIADEPTSELDLVNRDVIIGRLRDAADVGAIVIVATHDPEVAEQTDDELHLVDGRVDDQVGGLAARLGRTPGGQPGGRLQGRSSGTPEDSADDQSLEICDQGHSAFRPPGR